MFELTYAMLELISATLQETYGILELGYGIHNRAMTSFT
jgi:hypothetical protein